jgi:hypothetical protein
MRKVLIINHVTIRSDNINVSGIHLLLFLNVKISLIKQFFKFLHVHVRAFCDQKKLESLSDVISAG